MSRSLKVVKVEVLVKERGRVLFRVSMLVRVDLIKVLGVIVRGKRGSGYLCILLFTRLRGFYPSPSIADTSCLSWSGATHPTPDSRPWRSYKGLLPDAKQS